MWPRRLAKSRPTTDTRSDGGCSSRCLCVVLISHAPTDAGSEGERFTMANFGCGRSPRQGSSSLSTFLLVLAHSVVRRKDANTPEDAAGSSEPDRQGQGALSLSMFMRLGIHGMSGHFYCADFSVGCWFRCFRILRLYGSLSGGMYLLFATTLRPDGQLSRLRKTWIVVNIERNQSFCSIITTVKFALSVTFSHIDS